MDRFEAPETRTAGLEAEIVKLKAKPKPRSDGCHYRHRQLRLWRRRAA